MGHYSYSNNYSKYIENLKLEKSRKNFKEFVDSTKEIKSEEIVIENNFSNKNEQQNISLNVEQAKKNNNDISFNNAPSSKENEELILESELSGKNSVDINNEYELPNKNDIKISNEQSLSRKNNKKISKEIELSDKAENQIDNENNVGSKTGKEVDVADEYSDKLENDLNDYNSNTKKSSSDIEIERSLGDKKENSLNREFELSIKDGTNLDRREENNIKNGTDLDRKEENNIKDDTDFNRYEDDNAKDGVKFKKQKDDGTKSVEEIIADIIEEKKDGKKFLDKESFGEKDSDDLPYIIATPKKIEYRNIELHNNMIDDLNIKGIANSVLPLTKKGEEQEYSYNAEKYNYYPAGTYSQQRSTQSTAFNDAANTILNPSNWDSLGEGIVNSLKVATDIIDMLNLVGASSNIYTSVTANKLRKDLKLGVNEKTKKDYAEFERNNNKIFNRDNTIRQKDENGTVRDFVAGSIPAPKKNEEETESKFEKNNTEAESLRKDDLIYIRYGSENLNGVDNDFTSEEIFTGKDESKQSGISSDDGSLDITKDNKKPALFKYLNADNVNLAYKVEPERWFNKVGGIGNIYVMPPFRELANTSYETDNKTDVAFKIPLQNNLKFEQMSRAAAWTSIEFFGRIGDVQQYSRTGSMEALNVTTKYFVDDEYYTMSRLQDIEMAYRSLVLPAESASNYEHNENPDAIEDSKYYYFTRPPIINIVLSDKGHNDKENGKPNLRLDSLAKNEVYKNLFTDLKTSWNKNDGYSHDLYYKNFVVTNVSIDKNQDEYNYYIEANNDGSNGEYFDTMGFTVSLTLLEIDGNYLGSMPSFNNYYNTISSRGLIR